MAFSVVKIRATSPDTLIGRIYTHQIAPNDYLIEITGEALVVEVSRSRALTRQVNGDLVPGPGVDQQVRFG